MGIFSDHARRLWESGYSVIPLEGKRPFINNWNQFRNRLPTDDEFDQWEQNYPDANIGLVTGPASGIVWVDIDTRDPELTSKIMNVLPPTPLRRFGAKGIALGYRWTPDIQHQKLRISNVEIGEIIVNTQLVLPPSIHPDTGKAYTYVGYMHLGSDSKQEELSEVPELWPSAFNDFEQAVLGQNVQIGTLDQVAGRNDMLKRLVGGLITAGLGVEEITARLYQADMQLNQNHPSGPLFSDPKEFRELSKQPMACAFRFVSSVFATSMRQMVARGEKIPQFAKAEAEIQQEGEYPIYREFFDKKFMNCKKDIISGQFLRFDGQQWQPVVEHLDAVKSYAIDSGLKPHKIIPHFDRYVMLKKTELLVSLPRWDGVDRIKELGNFVKLKSGDFAVFEDALKEWGANIFRRLYDDGAQNRCIILKGGQGLGKDSLIRSLLSSLGPYYAKFSTNRNEIEAWAQVTAKLVLHIEEFDQTGQMGVAFLKDLITRDWVNYRSPYAHAPVNRKCYGSFISSVNIDAVLRDETGNRRFAVFDLESIDWNYPKDWGPQIIAQFYALYNENYRAKSSTWNSVTESNTQFEQADVVPEMLSMWDQRVGLLSEQRGVVELNFAEISGVISDVCRAFDWKTKSVLTLLKANNRSRKSMHGALYWSALRKIEVKK